MICSQSPQNTNPALPVFRISEKKKNKKKKHSNKWWEQMQGGIHTAADVQQKG